MPPDKKDKNTSQFGKSIFDDGFFDEFNPNRDRAVRPWHQRVIGIASESGIGKSAVCQSVPYAIIVDADGAGPVNPKCKARLFPKPGEPIKVDHPKIPGEFVTTFGFDYIRALVLKTIEFKKANPEQPVMMVFDTITSIIEMRKRKLEIDKGKDGQIMNFEDMNAMETYPILARSITDLIDSLKAVGVGSIVCCHITRNTKTILKKGRGRETVTELAINMPNSIFKEICARLDEGFRLNYTEVVRDVKEGATKANGNPIILANKKQKMITVGTETAKEWSLTIDKGTGDNETIEMFCESRLPTFPRELTWGSDQFNVFEDVIIPAYEKASEDFMSTTAAK